MPKKKDEPKKDEPKVEGFDRKKAHEEAVAAATAEIAKT